MALQQLGPGRFVKEELWTRGSILRHLRVKKRDKMIWKLEFSRVNLFFKSS